MDLIRSTETYLGEKGVESPRPDAERLLASVLGVGRLDLYLQFDRPLTPEELDAFRERVRRRARREPLQYIEGAVDFRGVRLRVDRRALIPRPETEVLVGEVLAWTGGRAGLSVLDVGTGSGAIALALAAEGAFGRIVATDVSPDALSLARENAAALETHPAPEWREGPLFTPVRGERFDLIVSNPPYVREGEVAELAPEVGSWEPRRAVAGGPTGVEVAAAIARAAPRYARPGGLLALELGEGQAEEVRSLMVEVGGYGEIRIRPDLAGIPRFILADFSVPNGG